MTVFAVPRRVVATLALAAAAALTLGACTSADPADNAATDAATTQAEAPADAASGLAALGLADADARTVVDTLDALALSERPQDVFASIRPDELVITDADGVESSLPMPADAFYVSIAPYADGTHDCYYHSLTTCTGEMQSEEVRLLIVDNATGDVLVDEVRETFANGFIGVWLPRDLELTVTIEHDGLAATQEISTVNSDDATCITTMQLA